MSWDAQPPLQPPQPEEPQPGPLQPPPQAQPGEPFAPQGGWTSPAPHNPYEQAPPPYGQPPQPQYGQPNPYDQPPQPYDPQPYEQTIPYGQFPGQPVSFDQYGQQLPPQPPPGAAPWGQYGAPPPFYPGPPQKRSRTGLILGLGIGAVVIAAAVAVAVAMSSSTASAPSAGGGDTASAVAAGTPSSVADSPTTTTSTDAAQQTTHTIVLPTSAGPLHLLSNSDTAARIAKLRSSLSGNAAYSNPQIGFYSIGSSGSYSVWLLAESTAGIASFQDSVNTLGVLNIAKEIAGAASMKNTTVESPGPLGGALLCGTLTESSTNLRACEWVDDSSFGWAYFLPSVSQSKALAYTLALRGAAER